MEKIKDGSKAKGKKGEGIKRAIALVSGSYMLYDAIKNRRLVEGLGAGLLIYQGATGKRLLKEGVFQMVRSGR